MTTQSQSEACPSCGAEVVGARTFCWLCGERIGSADKVPQRQGIGVPNAIRRPDETISASAVAQTIAMTVVLVGLVSIAPGIGILFGILALPALVRTMMVVKHRDNLQRPVSGWECISLLFGSVLAISVMLCVVLCTSVWTLGASCAALEAGSQALGYPSHGHGVLSSHIPESLGFVPFLTGIAAGSAACWVMFLWARRRWQRHVGGH